MLTDHRFCLGSLVTVYLFWQSLFHPFQAMYRQCYLSIPGSLAGFATSGFTFTFHPLVAQFRLRLQPHVSLCRHSTSITVHLVYISSRCSMVMPPATREMPPPLRPHITSHGGAFSLRARVHWPSGSSDSCGEYHLFPRLAPLSPTAIASLFYYCFLSRFSRGFVSSVSI